MSQREFDNFDKHAETYRDVHNKNIQITGQDSDYFAEYKIKEVKNFIDLNHKKVLDFGCGDGISYKFFKKHFPDIEYYGVDVSEKSIALAKENYPDGNFTQFDGTHLPFEANSMDMIFTACVFHHIDFKYHADLINQFYEILKPTGRLVIFEHNPWNPLTMRAVNTCEFDEDAVLLSPTYSHQLLADSNFKKSSNNFTLFMPRVSIFNYLLFLENYLKWLPIGGQYYVLAEKK